MQSFRIKLGDDREANVQILLNDKMHVSLGKGYWDLTPAEIKRARRQCYAILAETKRRQWRDKNKIKKEEPPTIFSQKS